LSTHRTPPDYADALVRTHDAVVEAHTRHGYQLAILPKAGVGTRIAFIRHHLGSR
jgi:predicted ATPase